MVTALITALAALTRTVNLGSPTDAGTPIFDEKHYAPQAWQMMHNHGVEDNPGYGLVVHPPVGKQLIAIGEAIFGYNGLGWRFTGAVLGVFLVALVVRIVRRITRSTLVGAIAGLLLIGDGVSFVVARTALLDGFLAFFVVAAFGALIVDRDQVRERMHVALTEGRSAETLWGPRLGVRWWRFGAGVLLGLACATKWSGLYFVVFFGLMSLAFDVAARRQYRVPRPWLGIVRRDLAPPPTRSAHPVRGVPGQLRAMVRLGDRNRSPRGRPVDRAAVEFSAPRCHPLAVALHRQGLPVPCWPDELSRQLPSVGIQTVGVADVAAAGALRHRSAERPGCGAQSCVKAVMLVGTPAMWWLAVPVLGCACWRMIVCRDWRYAAVLVGYCAGWLPWFADIDRQMYFFYAATMAPFLVMAIALILGDIALHAGSGCRTPHARPDRGVLLCRTGIDELRLAVSGAYGQPDFTVHLEHGDLVAQLALTVGVANSSDGCGLVCFHNPRV